MNKLKIGDRVLQKPEWANPDVLVIQSFNDDETAATCHTEMGSTLFVIEGIPVADLTPAPPRRDGWMQ